MTKIIKLICEIAPLGVFFYMHKPYGIINATLGMVIATVIAVIINYFNEKKLSIAPLISAIILGIFGMLTVFTGDSTFIKIKPTIIYLVFAIVILGSVLINKNIIKMALGENLALPEEIWKKFSIRWGVFFIALAGLNEIIWRNFSESLWVKFKVFGFFPLIIIFFLTQAPLLGKYLKNDNEQK
ncbi:MAG: septation protein A [Alphaproteobacteria bacterium]